MSTLVKKKPLPFYKSLFKNALTNLIKLQSQIYFTPLWILEPHRERYHIIYPYIKCRG